MPNRNTASPTARRGGDSSQCHTTARYAGTTPRSRTASGAQSREPTSKPSRCWMAPLTLRLAPTPDIDHVACANDPEALLSTDAEANRTKGDKGPEAWKSPNREYWCEYARRWIWNKSDWHLSVNPAEKSSLREMLGTCGAA